MTDEGAQVRLKLTERYINITAVAQLLDVARTTVIALIDEGELSSAQFGAKGGATRVSEASLIEFLTRRGIKFEATADGVSLTNPAEPNPA